MKNKLEQKSLEINSKFRWGEGWVELDGKMREIISRSIYIYSRPFTYKIKIKIKHLLSKE